MKRGWETGLLFAACILVPALSVLAGVMFAYRVQGLAEVVADVEYIRVADECERCREKEATNWTAVLERHVRAEACCWDLVETMRGEYEREVLEARCEDWSRGLSETVE